MAELVREIKGDLDRILDEVENAVLHGSATASLEGRSSYYSEDGVRCELRVYERYSWSGGNRLSMTVMLAGKDGKNQLSVITSGGSQAMFWKVNTWGEESFLRTIEDVVDAL